MRVEAGQERGRDSDEDDGLLIFRAVWCGWQMVDAETRIGILTNN